MGNEFASPEDRGMYNVDIELPAGTRLEESARLSLPAELELAADPRFITTYAQSGVGGRSNRITYRIVALPKTERDLTQTELQQITREIVLRHMPEAEVTITDPRWWRARATTPSRSTSRATTTRRWSRPRSGCGSCSPPSRARATWICSTRRAAPSSASASTATAPRSSACRSPRWRAPCAPRWRARWRASTATGTTRSTSACASARRTAPTPAASPAFGCRCRAASCRSRTSRRWSGPRARREIQRANRRRIITLTGAPDGRPLGDVVQEFERRVRAEALPPGITWSLEGQAKMMQESNENLAIAFLLGIVFIYLVLASQFESFLHPVTIMMALPLAIVGALVALFLQGSTLSMGAMIGFILLMGLVTKNGILLVDHAVTKVREEGWDARRAILDAGPARLRPILMTSAAMVLGMLPTALNEGPGSEFRSPMAMGVIGGVISSTFLTLIVVPIFYLAMEALRRWFARWVLGLPTPVVRPPDEEVAPPALEAAAEE
ncbi:MAG: efflux RND transporter permease subunit [Sandaracinaceae bacterium]|nr:efflux RND transporter permease subunit [Sandaracinaceae bacterium]